MYRFLFLTLAVLIVLPACSSEDARDRPEKVDVKGADEVPEITSQDIARKIILDSAIDFPVPPAGTRFPPAVRNNMVRMLALAKQQHSLDPKGMEALGFVTQRLEKRVKEFERAELWEHVIGFIEAHQAMVPGSSKYNRLKNKAMIELRRPKLTLRGLTNINGHQVATMGFYLPISSEHHDERMYMGDQKHGIKVIKVFGKNLGVKVEYLETSEQYIIYLKSTK